ncbi:hypothetical protein ABZ949_02385 [Micromonospora tulbaghiae]|uniref:hypothetical protein n=1 Tax=Micromonospora tulbaghiae TaxID=479978 RepID=UPI0033F2DAAC
MEITTGGHSVIVDADGPLDQVSGKALYLWERTRDPKLDRAFTPGFTPVLERAELPTYAADHDATLNQRRPNPPVDREEGRRA